MGQPKETRLTSEVAQQICERTASVVVLEGSIASLGSQFVLGLRAKNCNTGSILDQEQIQAATREDVLNSLSEIVRKLRTRLGESLATVEKHSTPLADATTSSLEALKAYSTGQKLNLTSGSAAAIPLFRRAVDIDPNFALAHAHLGLKYSEVGATVLSAESATRAWQLRDRVSDRERFFIDFIYDRDVTGNLEKAYQTLELWLQTYPRRGEAPFPHGLLGGLSTHGTGRFERAIDAARKEIAAAPDVGECVRQSCAELFPDRPLPRSGEHASARLRAQAGTAKQSSPAIQHRAAKRRPGADGPRSRSGQGQAGGRTRNGSRGGSRSGSFRPLAGGPAVIEPSRGSGAAEGRNAKRQRPTRPHERCGKPCAGMLPKRQGTPWRRWRFRTAEMSNTWAPLPWLFRETPLDRNRLPMTSKSASRKIRSPNLLTFRFFAGYPHWTARSPRTAWSSYKSLCPMNWR